MTNQLTRREFLKLWGASSVGLTLAACGVAPTATPAPTNAPTLTGAPAVPNTATMIATPPAPTATLVPTNTPTRTSAPTVPNTATMTVTPRSTETPSPTPMEQVTRGRQIFFDSFASGKPINTSERQWAFVSEIGTVVDYVSDPTDPSRMVMRATINGNPILDPTPNFKPKGQYWYTGYLSWRNDRNASIHATEVKIYFPSKGWIPNAGVSIFSCHGGNNRDDVVGMELYNFQRGNINLIFRDGNGNGSSKLIAGLGNIQDRWLTFRFEFRNGQTKYFIDGKEYWTAEFNFQPADVHAGILRSFPTAQENIFQPGNYILNKDFVVEVP